MGKKCAIVALALLVFAVDVHCQSQSCGLKVTPAKAVRVRPGHDVTLVCDASCFGPLSRDQLQWRDPRGGRIPAQAAGVRLFAVTYNRWKLSRVVLLNPQLGDSGVYTCELRHGGQHLQYAAVVQVEDDEEVDVGPRRGDIYIEPDPDFTNTRPVRSVPSDVQGDAENDDSFPDYPGEVSDPRDSPDEPGDDADLYVDSDYDTELHDNANSELGVKDGLKDIDPEVMFTPNGRNMAGMKQLSITKELSGNARLDDVKTQVRIRRNVGDEGGSFNNDTSPGFYDNETTTQGSVMLDNNAPDQNSTSQPHLLDYHSNVSDAFPIGGDMLNSTQLLVTPVLTPMDINDNVTSTVAGEITSTLISTFAGASSTTAFTPDVANSTKPTGTPPPVTQKPTAASTTTTPAVTTTVKTAAPGKTTPKYTPGWSKPPHTKPITNAGTDPDFGRYGVLAFALALSAAFLLLVALLLVLLCPRFFSGKRQKHIINTPGEEGGERHGGARPRSRGDGDGVFLMGEVPHKKLTPMTSATGLNGEYHTAIDLDSDDPNKVKAKEGQVQEEAKKNAAEGEKKEEEAKPQESFVSTFLIGRLSSSKQTEGEKLGDTSAVEGDEDVFKSAPAGADKPVTESEAKEEKEEKEAKEEKEEKEKKKEGSSSSGSSSSSSDSDAEETGKKDSSDDGNDARPASIGSGAGMMPNIRIEFKETNMDEV